MLEVYVNKKIVKEGADKLILRTYDKLRGTFNYYLYDDEGDIIMQVRDCKCTRTPKIMLDEYESFSVERKRAKKRANFRTWLEREGYKNEKK